jgi:hypothetical protein
MAMRSLASVPMYLLWTENGVRDDDAMQWLSFSDGDLPALP